MRLPARHCSIRHCSIRHRHAAPLSCADERPPPDVFVLAGDVASSLLYGAVESATDGWLVVAEGRDAATDPDVLPLPLLQAGELAVWWVLCTRHTQSAPVLSEGILDAPLHSKRERK